MSIMTNPLIIPPDVQIVPVADLPETMQTQLEWSEGDVAITRLRSRVPSKVVNREFAAFFNEFQSQKSVVEAVAHYGLANAIDPRTLLEDVYPLLQQFVGHGLLLPPAMAEQTAKRQLQRGDQVDVYSIVRLVRTLQDTEIYQASTPAGQTVALKMKQPHASGMIDHLLQHEADLLKRIGGNGAVQLIGQGVWGQRPYLAIAWCQGVDVLQAAVELRDQRDQLLDLCTAVLDVYAQLHENDVFHGDIHPGNIMVDGDNKVTLIDFGLAHAAQSPAPYRGGVPFYYEPEYAAAFLQKQSPPVSNAAAEQYALAALLYQLITGTTYINFSLEEGVLYRQILEEEQRPFHEHDITPWPEVETVLARALAKKPQERFPNIAAFATALRAAKHKTQPAKQALAAILTSHPLIADVLQQLQMDGPLLQHGLPQNPHASVNFGSAGVAYVLYRLACLGGEPALLALADVWQTRAEQALGDEAGFYNADLEMDAPTIGHISPYHTPSGLFAVRYLIAQAMGDAHAQMRALAGFVTLADQPSDNVDITLGQAGVLLIAALLFEQLTEKSWADDVDLRLLGDKIQAELWQTIDSYGPINADCELRNLGMAHGWAGLLFATMRWHEATGHPLPKTLPQRLTQLANQAEMIGRGVCWPWEFGPEQTSMSGWCNGSAGYIYLWSLAYKLFDEARYYDLVKDAGWHVWEDANNNGSLCCGLAGRSYSLLHLFQVTDDNHWLQRAQSLAGQAAYHIRHSQPPEYAEFTMSLYKGELAVALLLSDFAAPDLATLPFFATAY